MWVKFEDIKFVEGMMSKDGKSYSGWVASGIKKGYGEEPDKEWQKTFFDNSTCTIIEKGILRPGLSIVQFLQRGVKPGDTVEIKSEKDGRFWRIVSMENISNRVAEYTPLTDEQIAHAQVSSAALAQPAAPASTEQYTAVPKWLAGA